MKNKIDSKLDQIEKALENFEYSGPVKELIDTAKEFCDRVENLVSLNPV
jgi:hypothetical protein